MTATSAVSSSAQQLQGVLEFYSALASEYSEQFADWPAEALKQGGVLRDLIRRESPTARTVLDCACGIGTQAIGLARAGFDVVGTDVCVETLERARRNASVLAPEIAFHESAFCELPHRVQQQFDVVCCCDNALPHLLRDEEMVAALGAMRTRLVDTGLLIVSIRDYDDARRRRADGTIPRMYNTANGPRILFQIWEWKTEQVYRLQHFLMSWDGRHWRTQQYSVDYRAVTRRELGRLIGEAGFPSPTWHMPEETGYHQPLVTARVERSRLRR